MSSRRVPLSSNQNAANSPLRANAAAKQKRTLAQLQREEPYGQPPPAKKQMLENGTQRLFKPTSQQPRVTKSQIPVQQRRDVSSYDVKVARERSASHQRTESVPSKYTEQDIAEIRNWQRHHRERFPDFVFYFEKIPDDVRHSLTKQITALNAREAVFFSNEVTHIVTTRSVPSGRSASHRDEQDAVAEKEGDHGQEAEAEQVETINPSLLSRLPGAPVKRRVLDVEPRGRKLPLQTQDQATKQPKRNMDILLRAKEMGKKIWSLDKLQRMLILLLESDPVVSADIAYGTKRATARASHTESRTTEDRNLLRLLHNERVNGPSDRDPTVTARELHHFKGPYIYVYDVEEKQKPIMVREYPKVAEKAQGEWPQFRTASLGRCPFIEDHDAREARSQPKPKAQVTKANTVDSKPVLQPSKMAPPKPVTRKRTIGEMDVGHSRGSSVASLDLVNPSKLVSGRDAEFRPNAFTSRAAAGRLFGGEPVASGVQPSNMTSAIRSQMISSTAATPGVITGLSKEVHGLQRQVLKRNNSTATSQDPSSRRNAETSFKDDSSARRPLTLGRTSNRKLDLIDETATDKTDREDAKHASHAERRTAAKPKKRELKPGYCENCAEKYADFDEHIDSKKHRKFADNDQNWLELDSLLSQLERIPKHKSWTPTLSECEENY